MLVLLAALVLGTRVETLALLKERAAAAERSGDRKQIASAWRSLAERYHVTMDWAAELDAAQRAYDADPGPVARVRFLMDRGTVYQNLRDRSASESALNEALELARRLNEPALEAETLHRLGVLYYRVDDDAPRARDLYQRALVIARKLRDEPTIVEVLNHLANLTREYDPARSEPLYLEALSIAQRIGTHTGFLLKNLGFVCRKLGRRAEAEQWLTEAVAAAERENDPRAGWQVRMELGKLLVDADPARASRWFTEALDTLEAQHSNVLLEEFSTAGMSGSIGIYEDPYERFIEHLLGQNDAAGALQVSERARARLFLDTLAARREELSARMPPETVRAERELMQDISDRQSRLRRGDLSPSDESALLGGIQQDEEKLSALRLRVAADHPEIARVRRADLLPAAEIRQRLLAPGEAMLEYFLGEHTSVVWTVRPDGLEVARLPPKKEIEAAVRRFVDAISIPDGDHAAAGRALSAILLPKEIGPRVIVVPHGILHYLPFEALPGADGKFFLENHVISYAPSASSLAFLRDRPPPKGGEVVAIGNPILSSGADDLRQVSVAQIGLLKALPHTARELDAVAGSPWGGGRILAGDRATEPALAEARLESAAILHFATHGIIDERVPQRSGLVLTRAPGSDGILQMREIPQLSLDAALVTLSACQTALGKEIVGEGTIGLSRAFFQAGARAVMASLWSVNDASTADFMARFYAALRSGRPIDEAARAAKASFIAEGGRRAHPFYWAAFIVTGDARRAVETVRPRLRLLEAALAAGIAGLAAIRLRRRKAAVSVDPA